MDSRKLLIRVDANVKIGTGHVMRCLALAQAWQDRGGDVVFAMAESSAGIDERLRLEQAQISRLDAMPGSADDAAQTASLARELQADWAVVDGYHFDSAYQRFLKDTGLQLLIIDDYDHAGHYFCQRESLHLARKVHTSVSGPGLRPPAAGIQSVARVETGDCADSKESIGYDGRERSGERYLCGAAGHAPG